MESRHDFLVGLLIVAAIAVVVGAVIATSGWLERRYDLYMRAVSAEGLSVDTKVLVQGLEIGRVTRIVPRVDPLTRKISFVARLSVAARFADGSSLQLPVGTRAEIALVTGISTAANIHLLLPDTVGRQHAMLAAGDTITSQRLGSPLDQVRDVASQLSREVGLVLHQSHRTLERVQATLARADQTIGDLAPAVQTAVERMATTMGRVDSLARRLGAQGVPDSLAATLAAANRLLGRLDSLASHATALTTENAADIRAAVVHLAQMSRQLNHFVEELSRRPYRLFTGVKPVAPPAAAPDSAHAADPAVRPKP